MAILPIYSSFSIDIILLPVGLEGLYIFVVLLFLLYVRVYRYPDVHEEYQLGVPEQ